MPGTKAGGQKTKAKILASNPNHYSEAGKKGADAYNKKLKAGTAKPRGFAKDKELAKRAGAIGGKATWSK